MNLYRVLIIQFLLFFVFSFSASGQKPVLSGINELLILDKEEVEASLPLLSADREILYFVKTFSENNIGGIKGGQDIWFSRRLDSTTWQTANNFEVFNNGYNNMIIGVSQQNKEFHLLNTYSSPNRWEYSIAISNLRPDSSWSIPEELDLKFNTTGDFKSFYSMPDEEIIFMSAESSSTLGKEDIYIYYKEDEEWVGPTSLGENVNTSASEISPFYSPDLKALFFSSDGREGYGDFDIYMAKKIGATWDEWSTPINLGPTVNSGAFDAYLSTYEGGETFFVSNRSSESARIFSGNLSFIEEVIPEPVDSIPEEKPIVVVDSVPEYYVVQVLALSSGKSPAKGFFRNLGEVEIELSIGKDGLERYYIGRYKEKDEAITRMTEVQGKGYVDAFIRPIMKYSDL